MTGDELAALARAHRLFDGGTGGVPLTAGTAFYDGLLDRTAGLHAGRGYPALVDAGREALRSAAGTDAAVAAVLAAAHRDHGQAWQQTGHVVDQARAEAGAGADTALAQRELMRRRAARLRDQRAHVLRARHNARRHRARLGALNYRVPDRRRDAVAGLRLPPPGSRAGVAVRAALSRLGRPYVWGATGPDRFDCSGLTQWSYAQAGLHLDRTTYQQIHQGVPVPHTQVRAGDLVFPNTGHVQLAIGDNLVVEAPHSGATVRISPLGAAVQIRRPLG